MRNTDTDADRGHERGRRADDRWAAQIAALDQSADSPPGRKAPLSVERILEVAFGLVETEGFNGLTMRRVAAVLQTGPASLYAHVQNKAELDDLMIGGLCARVQLPEPDPEHWTEQISDVCRQLRDQFLRYPGVSQAALAARPNSLDTLTLSEGMLGILLAGGVEPQPAAWAIDALYLYVSAYSLEWSLRARSTSQGLDPEDRAALIERFEMLPTQRFPHTVAHARELTSGHGHQRFDATLTLLLSGLTGPNTPRRSSQTTR